MISKSKILILFLLLVLLSMTSVSASDVGDGAIQMGNSTLDDVIASNEANGQDMVASSEGDILNARSFNSLQTLIDEANESAEITLSDDYLLGGDDHVIFISKNITLNGNHHYLDGNKLNRIISIEADGKSVVLKNIIFKNGKNPAIGGAIINTHHSSLTLINCHFEDNVGGYGGAVANKGDLAIFNSTFVSNKVLMDCGGAVYSEGSLLIVNSNFSSNNAQDTAGNGYGGAIYSRCAINISNSNFNKNSAGTSGAAIYSLEKVTVTNSTFKENAISASWGDVYGGAIYSENEIEVSNSEFNDNVAGTNKNAGRSFGGALYSKGSCSVDSCIFNYNSAVNGAAIYVEDVLTIKGPNTFYKQKTVHATIYADKGVYINWDSDNQNDVCEISSETHKSGPGAIECRRGNVYAKFLRVHDIDVEGGALVTVGAAIHCGDSDHKVFGEIHVSNSQFHDLSYVNDDNSIEVVTNIMAYGGALYCWGDCYIDSCGFDSCYATLGGAVYARKNITITGDSVFSRNRADNKYSDFPLHTPLGNAIYCEGDLLVSGAEFSDNVGNGYGGAIYCKGKTIVYNSLFDSNAAYNIGGTSKLPLKYYGGAIYSEGLVFINGSNFTKNHAGNWGGAVYTDEEAQIEGCNFEDNYARSAGAVYAPKISGFYDSSFINNEATHGEGGAVYINNKCNPEFVSCRFEENTCKELGGAIYIRSEYSYLRLYNCSFDSNSAGLRGGAVFAHQLTEYLSYTTFTNNKASDNGGALFVANDDPLNFKIKCEVSACRFENNTCDGSGGGVYFGSSYSKLKITSSTFNNNSANMGGAVFAHMVTEDNHHSVFLNNKATLNGGAIYIVDKCNPEFVSCRFENNVANNVGGAIYIGTAGSGLKASYCTFVDNDAYKEHYGNYYHGAGKSVFNKGHYDLVDMCWFGTNNPDFKEQLVEYWGTNDEDYIPKNYLTISMIINDTDIYLGNTYEAAVHLSAINHKPLEKDLLHSNGLINTFDGNCSHGALGCNDITADISFNRENPLLFGRLDHEAVTLRLNTKSKVPSEVRILSCEDIVYPDTFKVTYEIVNWTNPVYVLKDSKGKVVRGGAITSPDTLVVDHLLTVGSYSITITNPESSTVDSSNATANFRVLRQVNGTVTADNVVYGNPTTITLKTTTNGVYNVVIDDFVIEMEVIDGICVKQVMLNAGEYQTHTIGLGLVALNCSEASFTVSKAVPLFKLNVSSHEFIYGDEVFVNHTLTSNATGYIAYYLNNEKYANLSVNDSLNLSGLGVGSHIIDAVYSGDSNYCSANDSVAVKVNPIPNNAAVSVDDITYGEDALIEVFADVDGEYSVDVNGTLVTVSVNNGVGNKSIRLDAGNYYANVTFNNKNYNTSSKNTTFCVYKANITLIIEVLDEVYPQDVEATVYASRDGMYNLTVAEFFTVVTVKNGLAYINAGTVDAGSYEAIISFSGDDNYNFAKNSTKFVVNASGTLFEIEINPSEITYGETADVTHTLSDGATGNITYYLSNGTFLGELPFNEILTLPVLDVGLYVVVADYSGDRDYMPASDIAFITVGPALNSVMVSADEVTYGMESVIEISADVDGTYQLDINGTVYNVTVKNGAGNKTIALDAGSYYANATFVDDNYVTNVKNTTFVVNKARNNVVVIVGNVTYGEITIVEVFADVDGTYQVDVNGTVYNVTVNDGIGDKSISLDAGSYYANATFGNGNYATVSKNATFSVYKADNNLVVVAFNTTYPYDVEGIVYADVDGKYNLTVGNHSTVVAVNNGVGEFNAGLFDAGEYPVVVDYPGDLNHKSNSSSTNVVVDKFAPDVSLYVSDFDYGDVGVIMITCDVPGSVNVTVNGITETLDLNGQSKDVLFATFIGILRAGYDAELSLYNLNAGYYPVCAVYNGDKNFESVKTSGEFTVNALNVTMDIDAGDISVGSDEIITVSLPSDVGGNVTVTVDGGNYTEPVKDGKAVITISNLAEGSKKAIVYYSGDLNHNPAMANVSFKVNKFKADMSAVSNNPNSGEMAHIVVSLPHDATGTVTVFIDGKDYTAPVENGKAVFNIPGLAAGKYKFTAYYAGDDKYYPANAAGIIKVSQNNDTDKNKTIDHPRVGGVVLSDYPTGNPLLILLTLMATGFVVVRRFRE